MSTSDLPTPADASATVPAATAAELLAAGGAAGTWKLDADASQVEFHSASMWGLVKIHGRFASVSGEGSVSPEGSVTGELVVEAASLDTRNKKRDVHLRSKDFFDVTEFPTLTYAVQSISPVAGDEVQVEGTLTVRGQQRPLPFTAKVTAAGADTVEVAAELDVERSQFGMTWRPMKVASMHNRIVVTARFHRAAG